MKKFLTIALDTAEWEQIIKKSRFIVNFSRVKNEDEARNFVERISKQHYKATHNVFAYVIGPNDEIKRYSDNGEPSGTAGIPMLEVMQQQGVHDVAAVVTRYFGGIKLGAGGLIRAYAGTTAQGLDAIGLVERLTRLQVQIDIDYKSAETLTYWLNSNNYPLLKTNYDTAVHLTVAVAEEELLTFKDTLVNHFSGQITFKIGHPTYLEIPAD